jgi:formamidopyrimidine-DNA glycosylase
MPELPEVEEVRRSLEPHVLGIAIESIRVLRPDFVTPAKAPLKNLLGQKITRTLRHGKKLFLIAGDNQTLLIHLGMSGHVDCLPPGQAIARHTHVIFSLANGIEMRLHDPRRFGGLWYYASFEKALAAETTALGKDALQITAADFAHWRSAKGRLKQRLLSQKDVAGLGNIYVDEALWMSNLHPLQRVSRIAPDKVAHLVAAIHTVLNRSIRSGGTTLRDYRNVSNQPGQFARQLQAYGRGGEPCRRCQTPLRSQQIATRTTVFCPKCQRQR